MKAREPRTRVILPARIRWDGRWTAATVRNLSSRGLMLVSAVPPPPGTYVEVQIAASQTIVARTMWTEQQQCGLLAQGRLDVARLCSGRSSADAAHAPDRRSAARHDPRASAERSRRFAATFQYLTVAVFAITAAASVGWEVYKTLSAPFTIVEAKLSRPA